MWPGHIWCHVHARGIGVLASACCAMFPWQVLHRRDFGCGSCGLVNLGREEQVITIYSGSEIVDGVMAMPHTNPVEEAQRSHHVVSRRLCCVVKAHPAEGISEEDPEARFVPDLDFAGVYYHTPSDDLGTGI